MFDSCLILLVVFSSSLVIHFCIFLGFFLLRRMLFIGLIWLFMLNWAKYEALQSILRCL